MNQIFIEKINNKSKIIDYAYSTIIFLGSASFLVVGISSYLKSNLISIFNADQIIFFPQGITMTFYGIIGCTLSFFQLITLYYSVGEGYNEYNKDEGIIKIFRNGYPGKNSNINIIYKIKDILRT